MARRGISRRPLHLLTPAERCRFSPRASIASRWSKNPNLRDGAIAEFRTRYYEWRADTTAHERRLGRDGAGAQVLYGTDFPYRDGAEVNEGIADWKFSAADLRAIENETAKKLLPRLKG